MSDMYPGRKTSVRALPGVETIGNLAAIRQGVKAGFGHPRSMRRFGKSGKRVEARALRG